MKAPRYYQSDCIQAIINRRPDVVRQAVVLPTGTGKGVIIGSLPAAVGIRPHERVLCLTHKEEIAEQSAGHFTGWSQMKVGIEMADRWAPADAQCVVASVQTLQGDRLKRINPDQFPLVLVDECHHIPGAETWQEVLRHFKVLKGDNPDERKLLVGFTATPERTDHLGLDLYLDEIVYHKPLLECIDEGWVTDIIGIRIETKVDISSVDKRMGDFVVKQLAKQVDVPSRNQQVVSEYLRVSRGGMRTGITFSADIEHTEHLTATFQRYGVSAVGLSDHTPKNVRRDAIQAARNGGIQMLVSCQMISEGTDIPIAEIACMAAPTMSGLTYRQRAGRVTRPYPSKEEVDSAKAKGISIPRIKRSCFILDFVDVSRFSLHTAPTLLGLHPDFDTEGESVAKAYRRLQQEHVAHPNIVLADVRSVAEISTLSQRVNLLAAPQFPSELDGMTRLAWLRDIGGEGYRLSLPDGKSISAAPNILGQWEVWRVDAGARTLIATKPKLIEAIAVGDSSVPRAGGGGTWKERAIRQRIQNALTNKDAKWRSKRPSHKALAYLWRLDSQTKEKALHQSFSGSYENFVEEAKKKYRANDIAHQIDTLITQLGIKRKETFPARRRHAR